MDQLVCPNCSSRLEPTKSLHSGVYSGECGVCKSKLKFRVNSEVPGPCHGGSQKQCKKGCSGSSSKPVSSPLPITSISFTLNGNQVTVDNPDPLMTLNEYIRTVANLKGTKKSCLEGGCGSCVVNLTQFDSVQQKNVTFSVNSCLRPLCSVDGSSITTIEALTSSSGVLSPISTTLAQFNGSQCGFCSSGIVMNMNALLSSSPSPSLSQIETLFDGNICRCTGYRPILDAMRTFVESDEKTDIEDIVTKNRRHCSTLPCARDCHAPSARAAHVVFQSGQYVWTRPLSLVEVFEDLAIYSGQPYKLVFGNTSIGIFKDDPTLIFIDISNVTELQTVQVTSSSLIVGAGVSIANLILLLQNNAASSASFAVLVKHLNLVANVAVRNAGCWAGNIMLTHNNPDFPSDIFTIMAGANATLTIASKSGSQVYDFFSFLQLDMTDLVIVSISIPFLSAGQSLWTYKVMPRHVNAHAYVNCAFLMTVDDNQNVIGVPRLVFGGIGPYAVLASQTALSLQGQSLTNPQTLSNAMTVLQGELVPDQPPVSTSAAYRVSLACSLLYKFYLSLLPNANERVQSAALPFIRPISSSSQSFTSDPAEYPVSEPIPKLTAELQTSGQAQYTDDLPIIPGTLFASFAVSSVGPATLQSIDVSAALAYPGVVRVITAVDIPGDNDFMAVPLAPFPEPILVLIGKTIEYAGQGIAIVLADTQQHADAAALLVVASYTNILPPILTIDDAISQSTAKGGARADVGIIACDLPPLITGGAEQALKASPNTIQNTISCGPQYHMHMETQTAYCIPTEDGGLDAYVATQCPDYVNRAIAKATKLTGSKVRVMLRRMGGAYGGKITRSMLPAAACAVAAIVTQKPVRIQMNLNTNMELLGKRNPFRCDYNVGFDDAGLLLSVKLDYYMDCGSYPNDSIVILGMAMETCDNAYYSAEWQVIPNLVRTNTAANTSCRAPGCLPAIFVMETIMEHIATVLNISPDAVRFVNLYRAGQVTPYKQPLPYCNLTTLWSDMITSTNYSSRVAAVNEYNAQNRWRKQGISIAPVKYGLNWDACNFGVLVSIVASDGSVSIANGGTEMGQGIDTKVAQVAALLLGIPIGLVHIEPSDGFVNPNNAPTGGSVSSELCCLAVQDACNTLNASLNQVRPSMQNPTWQELVAQCYNLGISLSAKGWTALKNAGKHAFQYNSYGIVANTVEVDVLTGEIQILRTDILFDCGQSLNPALDIGQVEGAFVMGLGYFLTERLIYDTATGQLLTNGTWEYKPPSVLDIPIVFNVNLVPNAPNPLGFLGSKASGEPPLCMASSVLAAVKHAVISALSEIGQSNTYFPLNAPATVDYIQTSCLVNPNQFYF